MLVDLILPKLDTLCYPVIEDGIILRSFVSTQYRRVTERRIDGQTDRNAVANTTRSIAAGCKINSITKLQFLEFHLFTSSPIHPLINSRSSELTEWHLKSDEINAHELLFHCEYS